MRASASALPQLFDDGKDHQPWILGLWETSTVSWIYALRPDFTYDRLLKAGLRDAITSLAATARTLK